MPDEITTEHVDQTIATSVELIDDSARRDAEHKKEMAEAEAAIRQLLASDRGSVALTGLREWLNDYGFGLDAKNQEAISALLILAWGPLRGTVSQMIAIAMSAREAGLGD